MHAATTTNRDDRFPIRESDLLGRDELKKLTPDPQISLPLLGEHQYSLDGKNRVCIPATLRDLYSDGLMILRSKHATFFLLDPNQSRQFVENLDKRASVEATLQDRLLHIYRAALMVRSLDSENRLAIPADFAKRWQLSAGQKIMLCGNGKFLEMHTEQSWDRMLREKTLWDSLQLPPPDLL